MAAIEIFKNESFGEVRVAGTSDEPLFCAADICRALGYSNSRDAVAKHVAEEDVAKCDTLTPKGTQLMTYVNESGMYALIFGSKLQSARAFKKWVTSEILPAIRKTGSYVSPSYQIPQSYSEALMLAARQAEQLEEGRRQLQMLESENECLAEENRQMKPHADYTKDVLQSGSTYTLTQVAHDLGMRSVHVLTGWLRRKNVLFRQSNQWQPTAKVADKGYFSTRTAKFFHADGSVGTSISTVVTEQGRMYLHNLLQNAN